MIAIPNMSKPKSCEECPIKIGESVGVYYDSKSDEFKRVKITGCNESKYHTKTLGEDYEMMYKDCPLIEIVRCKDCKHNYNTAINHGKMQPRCDFTDWKLTENDYCSRGEREGE